MTKLTFPYEYYTSIEQLSADTSWPCYQHFSSTLTRKQPSCYRKIIVESLKLARELWPDISFSSFQRILNLNDFVIGSETDFAISNEMNKWFVVDPKVYLLSKFTFENREMQNMLEFLNHYNIIDVVVLTEAFLKFSRSFYSNFELNPLEFVSLPGMAEKAMWNNYDASVNSPYTFHNSFKSIAQLIRKQIIGGLSCCFHRHATTAKEPINDLTMRTPSGKPIKLIKSFDVNSM